VRASTATLELKTVQTRTRGSRVEFWSMHVSVNWRHRISDDRLL